MASPKRDNPKPHNKRPKTDKAHHFFFIYCKFLFKKYETIIQIIPTIKITSLLSIGAMPGKIIQSIRKSKRESTIPKITNKIPILFK